MSITFSMWFNGCSAPFMGNVNVVWEAATVVQSDTVTQNIIPFLLLHCNRFSYVHSFRVRSKEEIAVRNVTILSGIMLRIIMFFHESCGIAGCLDVFLLSIIS